MIADWWALHRKCVCGDRRCSHVLYKTKCGNCKCERFQWRLLKWVY